jgi:hypothetical protein
VDEPGSTFRMEVDGELFDVRHDAGQRGLYHFSWVSGPNPGYGFSSAAARPRTRTELESHIRGFLAQVDPETGYIE